MSAVDRHRPASQSSHRTRLGHSDRTSMTAKSSKHGTGFSGDIGDKMEIVPLGAGGEVGRSCCVLKFKGKMIMFDCGVHPAYSGMASLPYFDDADMTKIDLVLITHFHLDHAAGLPYLMEKTNLNPAARIFMTHPTKAIYKTVLTDFVRVSRNSSGVESLYTEEDVTATMKRIERVDYHAEVNVEGIKFRPYFAAHVLGGAMFMVEIAGVRVLYTGDFSRQEDRHLKPAELPPFSPHVLITESTYGTQIHQGQAMRERMLMNRVSTIVRRGGRVLLPVFAMGRAQELLLIFDEFWESNPDLQKVPIFYTGAMAERCMSVYETYINTMNDSIRRKLEESRNPFLFKHVKNIRSASHVRDDGPCVVLASPGMLQSGVSRELFERWCTEKRNGLIISGYTVEGTLGKKVLTEPETIKTLDGRELPMRCSVDYFSFSAHADYKQVEEFVNALQPEHILLVHGQSDRMGSLKARLDKEYNRGPEGMKFKIYTSENSRPLILRFREKPIAKVIGVVSQEDVEDAHGKQISGVMIRQDFAYTLIKEEELQKYTSLKTLHIDQRQVLPLRKLLITIATQLSTALGGTRYDERTETITVAGGITITKIDQDTVQMSWSSSNASDILADAVTAIVLSDAPHAALKDPEKARQLALITSRKLLASRFGPVRTSIKFPMKSRMIIDLLPVTLNHQTGTVECENETIRERVRLAYRRIQAAVYPIPEYFCECCLQCIAQ